jgi:glycosyltransferase involved in cell wall biosynthesis
MKKNSTEQIIYLLFFTIIIICFLVFYNGFIKMWIKTKYTNPYINSFNTSLPNKGEYTWLIHAYVPDHNAGSEWMAHAMNKYLIQEKGKKVNVISNKSSVNLYERVKIIQKDDTENVKEVIERACVLLTHHGMEGSAAKTAIVCKKPLVILLHDHNRYNGLREYKRLLHDNVYAVCNSEWIKDYYKNLGVSSIVVYPPVRWQEYTVVSSHEYVTLINTNVNKGGEIFVEIAKRMSDTKFLGIKGAYNKQIVEENTSNITYLDSTPYIKDIYSRTDILLMPSKEESWGRTAIEAMSSGIPVIAHPTPGLKESCGSAGIFCDRDDIEAWVKEITQLKTDRNYYDRKSSECLARAKELDPDKQLEKFSEWIKTLQWK